MLVLMLAASLVFEVPLAGNIERSNAETISILSQVGQVEVRDTRLRVTVNPGQTLSLSSLQQRLPVRIDRENLPITPRTILEIDAGQCFNCTERPLRKGLLREDWVESFSVVDYAERGRMRIRITPRTAVTLNRLRGIEISDILLTDRYDRVDRVELDWPSGGVAWRPGEAAAREEAVRARKPLLIFPSAGT